MNSKTKRIITIVAASFFALFVVLFLLRGVVRGTVIPSLVNTMYKDGVGKNFDQDFKPVNEKLAAFGFTFDKHLNAKYKCDSGKSVMYEGLKMDVSCLKTQRSDDRDFTADFAGNWKQHSTVFENYLQSTGWRKNATQPIHEIYDNPNNDVSIGVEYLKKHSKTTCELSVVYNASYPAPQTTYVIESCQRAVAPFGRY